MTEVASPLSIETREPTAEEIAATSAIQQEAEKAADSIQSRAAEAAIKAYGAADTSTYKAVVALALNLCGEQIRALLTDQNYDPHKDAYIFKRDILFPVATAGLMVYRDSMDQVATILEAAKGMKGKRKDSDAYKAAEAATKAAVKAYVNTKGAKLVKGMENLRRYGFRLASYMRDNMGSAVLEAARMPSAEAAEEFWNRKVAERFGDSFARLSSALDKLAEGAKAEGKAAKAAKAEGEAAQKAAGEAAEAKGKAEAFNRMDPVATIMGMVAELDDATFVNLMHRLKAEAEARGMMGGAKAEAEPAKAEPVILLGKAA